MKYRMKGGGQRGRNKRQIGKERRTGWEERKSNRVDRMEGRAGEGKRTERTKGRR